MKTKFTGSLVYHTGGNNIPAGVYFWDGVRWIATACDPPGVPPADTIPDQPVGIEESVGGKVANQFLLTP